MKTNLQRLIKRAPLTPGSIFFSKKVCCISCTRKYTCDGKSQRRFMTDAIIRTSLQMACKEDQDKSRRDAFLASIKDSLIKDVLPMVEGKLGSTTIMIVGVSGGCDSISLLRALQELSLPQLEVHAIHFDHHQRGIESDGDREFVEKQCNELRIPLHVYHWEKKQCEFFSQDRARTWRRKIMYDLLDSLVPKGHRGIIATAHHKNDSVETLMLKLLRGVHINNLSGMEVVSMPRDQPNAVWARPLLKATKDDIQHFLRSKSIPWREDASNASSKYKRNRVRNELLPLMADIIGNENLLEKRLENLSRQSRELSREIVKQAQKYLNESGSEDFFILPHEKISFIQKEALHHWCRTKGVSLSYDQFENVCSQLENFPGSIQWTLQVGDGYDIIRNGSAIYLKKDDEKDRGHNGWELITWSVVKEPVQFSTEVLLLRVPVLPPSCHHKALSGEVFRSPFTPSWRLGHNPMKLKDFLRGQKVPLHLRQNIPVILSGDGDIVAVQCDNSWVLDVRYCPLANKDGFLVELTLSP
eukprot:CAMPEP_0194214472 /NCGR_PEP_ID=MMETSP0156-20130528/15681_1 /TAXON_ID=33649 /ORGANISM="Thalassionema nitzschioides, Strain L26-B" /LENGTH=527 /DNA_ID=CAMNT_0038942731 /DNA_START=217 /DNA_END=1800 /DNA_ORIENTATION=-